MLSGGPVADARVLTWELPSHEFGQIASRIADLEMQMAPVREVSADVWMQEFSDVRLRLEWLERELKKNGP